MTEKEDLSRYDELIDSVVEEAGGSDVPEDEEQEITPPVPAASPEDISVDAFVSSVVEEAEMGEDAPATPEEEEEPAHVKKSLADFPDAKYKVRTYNDKSDYKAFYTYSILGRYPQFPIILGLVEIALSVWFAFSNHRQDLLQYALLYICVFILADVAFFWLRVNNIVKKLGQKDEHTLDTTRVEAAFYDDYVVLIKYGFDIKMEYERLEFFGRMGDRVYLYFDNSKALLLHKDDFDPKVYTAVEAMMRQVVRDNKERRKEKKTGSAGKTK